MTDDFVEYVTSLVFKAVAMTGTAEGLGWEAGENNVMRSSPLNLYALKRNEKGFTCGHSRDAKTSPQA